MQSKTNKSYSSSLIIFLLIAFLTSLSAMTYAVHADTILKTNSPQKTDTNLPPRLKRADSFFGIHFDFHAGQNDKKIGESITPEIIQNFIDKVKPDYIQVDTKGHAGCSSYPTKVGNQAGGFVCDPLKIWRDVTAKNGVSLYAHHSGVFDRCAVRLHPEWACVDADGKPRDDMTSVFGDYADKLLIPQLKELCSDYKLDGAWIDGECWAVKPDYSPKALEAFKKAAGITNFSKKSSDPNYSKFMDFNRQGFRNYLRHYIEELRKFDPSFQVTSNWAYSTKMPEPVNIDLPFLSGDYMPTNSVNSARFEGRFLRNQGKPWDLMAWSFTYYFDGQKRGHAYTTKPARQLQQEAAVVMALGGGFQAYYPQKRDASIYEWQVDSMAEIAKFCRARQKFCQKVQPVKEIALLLSTSVLYNDNYSLFSNWGSKATPFQGILTALLNSQLSVDIVAEHHLKPDMIQQWPLIIIPEWKYLPEDFKNNLISYAKNGGNLLIIGTETTQMFKDHLGVKITGSSKNSRSWLCHNNFLAGLQASYLPIQPDQNTTTLGQLYMSNDNKGHCLPAASIRNYEKGIIAAVYFDFGQPYLNDRTTVTHEFLNDLILKLYQPIVDVQGSNYVDVSVNKLGDKLAVNLVNTAGPHEDISICTFDDIPSVGPLKVAIRSLKSKPSKIHLEPAGVNLDYSFNNGTATMTIPKVELHEIIVVE